MLPKLFWKQVKLMTGNTEISYNVKIEDWFKHFKKSFQFNVENNVENEELDIELEEVEHTFFDSEITDSDITYVV